MREIKFRAWVDNGTIKEMHYPQEIEMNSADAWSLWYKLGFENAYNYSISEWQKNIIWLQYTGLKDKNGKEIYEGDIILYETYSCDGVMYNDTYYVIYEAPMFKLKAIQSHIFKPGAYIYFDNNVEVIGNIYETPELLK